MNDRPAPTSSASGSLPACASEISLEISPQEVAKLMAERADFLLIDCRKPEEREASCIAGSLFVPMQDLDLHIPRLREQIEKFIVVHCRTGRRSMSMTLLLRELGFAHVKSMAGGIERWAREIDASVTEATKGDASA